MDIKYKLPNGQIETKKLYDTNIYSDSQMAKMANQAVATAIRSYRVIEL